MNVRPQYLGNDSPRRQNQMPVPPRGAVSNRQMMEQSRYNDIMRSINSTQQFIKAKQAVAALERKQGAVNQGRNGTKKFHLSEIPGISSTQPSTLIQT